MQDRLFGIETEYAVSGVSGHGTPVEPEMLAADFLDRAAADLPHLCGRRGSDLFLQNGGRLYVDCGAHPEIATPECLDPWEIVRFVRAGDRIMARLASALQERQSPRQQITVFRSNVDYAGTFSTWGCHESYLHRSPLPEIAQQLVPHLVSRLIFTGAGGFDPMSPGLTFTLSPRAAHITTVESSESVSHRGIVHTRQEPLAGGTHRRFHIIFGESLCSDLALWLKVGTTALIVAMTDAGLEPGAGVQLVSPVEALRTFAADPTCKAKVLLITQRTARALDIQRHYLALAEAHRGAVFMPPWTSAVCARWREMLDLLECAPTSVSTRLDWAIKYALYIDHTRRRDFSWDSLPGWTRRVERIRDGGANQLPEDIKTATGGVSGPVPPEWPWRDPLPDFLKLRDELCEIDTRFGQLGSGGIFGALDRGGALDHRIDRVTDVDIERAVLHPPARGRARLRGDAIGRLLHEPDAHVCEWTGIWNRNTGCWLDLSDPFSQQERWRNPAATAAPAKQPDGWLGRP